MTTEQRKQVVSELNAIAEKCEADNEFAIASILYTLCGAIIGRRDTWLNEQMHPILKSLKEYIIIAGQSKDN